MYQFMKVAVIRTARNTVHKCDRVASHYSLVLFVKERKNMHYYRVVLVVVDAANEVSCVACGRAAVV